MYSRKLQKKRSNVLLFLTPREPETFQTYHITLVLNLFSSLDEYIELWKFCVIARGF